MHDSIHQQIHLVIWSFQQITTISDLITQKDKFKFDWLKQKRYKCCFSWKSKSLPKLHRFYRYTTKIFFSAVFTD